MEVPRVEGFQGEGMWSFRVPRAEGFRESGLGVRDLELGSRLRRLGIHSFRV